MATRKHRSSPRAAARSASRQLFRGLEDADALADRKKWPEALKTLRELDRRFPDCEEVLPRLIEAAHESRDYQTHQSACERWLRLRPDDPEPTFLLAGSCMVNGFPSLALTLFRRFLERWPGDARAKD